MHNRTKGILHILLAAFFFALMSFFVRLSGDVPSMQKAFFRNIVAMLAAAGMLLRTEEKFRIKKDVLPFLLIRSAAGFIGIIANFYAIDHMNIADANMLNKLSPFFALVFSFLILKEKASKLEWAAVAVAFVGALFIMKPSLSADFIPALVGAFGGLTAGLAYTMVRCCGIRGERGKMIVFFFSAFSTVCLIPNMLFNYTPMDAKQWLCLIAAGVMAAGGQLNITAAYTYAPAREISVFDYSQILFAALLGFFFLDQLPDMLSFLGYVIIIAAAVFRWFYQNRLAAETSPEKNPEKLQPRQTE